jgi:FtsH-binding integral membrane protein
VAQLLSALATHALALVLYPGLVTCAVSGGLAEIAWLSITTGGWSRRELPQRRPTPVLAAVLVCSILAAVQLATPFNPVPSEERSVVVAAIALAFTAWAELALTVELVAEPRLLLIVQFCWLLAVLGPAVQPETLRPQVLGNVLVPALLPLKIACAALYLLCLPALLRLWPFAPPGDRRTRRRADAARALCWFPYCGLFTTLFFTPPADDALGLLRFFGITAIVAALLMGAGVVMQRRGAALARALYTRAIAPYALVVLLVAIITSFGLR